MIEALDAADPATWNKLMTAAVAGFQKGDNGPATVYLQFVEKHRGRQIAEEARARIKVYAASPKWQPKAPPPPPAWKPPSKAFARRR